MDKDTGVIYIMVYHTVVLGEDVGQYLVEDVVVSLHRLLIRHTRLLKEVYRQHELPRRSKFQHPLMCTSKSIVECSK